MRLSASLYTEPMTIDAFWQSCRSAVPGLPQEPPEAWAFGATPAHADELLGLVLAGTKTATASSLWDYEHTGEALPEPGLLNIILDGRGAPRAVLRTVSVEIVPFHEVSDEHAYAEGEDDRSLASWKEVHERFWRAYSESPQGFKPDMPVLCEQFELLYSKS